MSDEKKILVVDDRQQFFSGNATAKLKTVALAGVSMMGERPRESHTRQHRTKKARAKTRAQKKARRRNRR